MKLLYITFIDFGEKGSGSGVRPHRMYDAFKALGYDVKLLECRQNKKKLRKKRVKEVLKALDNGYMPDICYVEPPSGPFFNRIDLTLLKRLHKLKVPIGLFYRDAYWRFAKWWGVNGVKKQILVYMHKRDIGVFKKCCDIVYFPSKSMEALFDKVFLKTAILPPGCKEPLLPPHEKLYNRVIYVGGVSLPYGTDILLKAFEKVNSDKILCRLCLVCRQDEWEVFDSPYKSRPWLEVHHVSGDEKLKPLYAESDMGIHPLRRDMYMDFAMPIKIFEYLSYGLLLIISDCTEMANFAKKYNCGIICSDNAESFAKAVMEFYEDKGAWGLLKAGVTRAGADNLWLSRAKTAAKDLSDIKK